MDHAVATLVHIASSDPAARADAMYQLVLVASAHESALRELAGPLCVARLIDIATNALRSEPEVAALAAWVFARIADGKAVPTSQAPQVVECLARMLPSNNDRVRAAATRAVQALADESAETRAIVLHRGRQDPAFRTELARDPRLQPLAAAAAASPTTPPGNAPLHGGSSSDGSAAGSSGQQQRWKVLRIDAELVLIVNASGQRATTVDEVLRRSMVWPITKLAPVACASMSANDRAAATSNLNVAFKSYIEADSMAQAAMEQISDQCEMLAEELLDEDSGESTDPELTEDADRIQKVLERVSQYRVTQLPNPKYPMHGATTVMYLEQLARRAKLAADEVEAFVVKSIDEAGHYFGFDLDDAPMDLSQLGESAAKLCSALKKTGLIIYVGCDVRPVVPSSPSTPGKKLPAVITAIKEALDMEGQLSPKQVIQYAVEQYGVNAKGTLKQQVAAVAAELEIDTGW